VSGFDDKGRSLRVENPMAAHLIELANETTVPDEIVDRLLGVREIFPIELAENDTFRRLVPMWFRRLVRDGVNNVLAELR